MIMSLKALILVLLAVAATCEDGVDFPPQPSPNSTTTVKPDTTTSSTTMAPNTTTTAPTPTPVPGPNTTTTAPTPTPAPGPNTTTTAPTPTPAPGPNTTTTAPTPTPAPGPNTTTTAPTPTPAPGPNTTTPHPSPTPVPEPEQGKWSVKNTTSNVTCIIADMAIQINVKYQTTENKTAVAVLDVPKDASATGNCGDDKQNLTLQWLHNDDKNYTNSLNMVFKKEVKDNKFVVENLQLRIAVNTDDFPKAPKNISNIMLSHNGTLFGTTLARSYKCAKQQEVSLFGNNTNSTIGTLKISHVQLEAFHEKNSTDFGSVEDCERSTDIVPITVGCALVGLVAVVLIGYLVGRRRSQARGYLSM